MIQQFKESLLALVYALFIFYIGTTVIVILLLILAASPVFLIINTVHEFILDIRGK